MLSQNYRERVKDLCSGMRGLTGQNYLSFEVHTCECESAASASTLQLCNFNFAILLTLQLQLYNFHLNITTLQL